MDIITQSFFEEFRQSYGYDEIDDAQAIKLFVEYSIVSCHFTSDTLNPTLLDSVNVVGDDDIDGMAVLVNGKVISSRQEVDDLLLANNELDVKFVFIQVQSGRTYEKNVYQNYISQINSIFNGILDAKEPNANNDDFADYCSLIVHIFSKSAKFRTSPQLFIYCVSLEQYSVEMTEGEEDNAILRGIEKYGILSSVQSKILGRKELVDYYKRTKAREEAEIVVDKKINLPDIPNVREGYLMLIPFSEFRKLIIDTPSDSIKNVFNDNIRAYQGENIVNRSMAETLRLGDFSMFTAMNNGITIIAHSLGVVGAKITLSDYQIVNGCQTCHVLFNNRKIHGIDQVQLLVKLISSADKTVRNSIIMGTNSQTEVKREQLIALSDLQERIEDYYNAVKRYERLYYERRSKQYRNETKVPQYKVITIPVQIMSFVSMFLSEPHNVRGYYGSIVEHLEKSNKKIFSEQYQLDSYYTSGLTYFQITRMFDRNIIPRFYKAVKFHLMLAFRLIAERKIGHMPSLYNLSMARFCEDINVILSTPQLCEQYFIEATCLMEKALGRSPKGSDRLSKRFTEALFKQAEIYEEMEQQASTRQDLLQNLSTQLSLNMLKKNPFVIVVSGEDQVSMALRRLFANAERHIRISLEQVNTFALSGTDVVQAVDHFVGSKGCIWLLVSSKDFRYKAKRSRFFQRLANLQSGGFTVEVREMEVGEKRQNHLSNTYIFDDTCCYYEFFQQGKALTGTIDLYNSGRAKKEVADFDQRWESVGRPIELFKIYDE